MANMLCEMTPAPNKFDIPTYSRIFLNCPFSWYAEDRNAFILRELFCAEDQKAFFMREFGMGMASLKKIRL